MHGASHRSFTRISSIPERQCLYHHYARRLATDTIAAPLEVSDLPSPRPTITDNNAKAREADTILDGLDENDDEDSDSKIQQAWKLVEEARAEGSVRGCTLQGFMYGQGMGVVKDAEKAKQLLSEAAELGDPYAQFGIGKILLDELREEGEDREKLEAGKAFVVESDDGGKVKGRMEFVGKGKKDMPTPAEMVRKVRKARRKDGFSDAEALEFEQYKLDKKERSDKEKRKMALEWLRRAGEDGVAAAYVLLGDVINSEDAALARDWYEKAAKETRDAKVYFRLGQLYFQGGNGLEKDPKLALKNLSMAANLGDANAQFYLGHAYRVGELELEVDFPASLQYIEMAAKQKHPAALYYLALMHRDGQGGLAVSIRIFRRYVKEAAALGHVDALFHLGEMHYKGIDGVEIDYRLALNYYRKAGEKGSADAFCSAAAMYFHGIGTPVSYEKAFNLYQEALVLGSTKAMQNLGAMHYQGHFVPKSQKRAKYYFDLAEEQEKMEKEAEKSVIAAGTRIERVTAKTRTPRTVDPGCGGGPNDP